MFRLKYLFPLAILVIAGGCADTGELTGADDFEIVGGVDANITDYPWQISLQTISGFHFCGGTVLTAEWVLTAQHCIQGQSPGGIRVAAGMSNLSQAESAGQIRNVAEIIPYPGYLDASKGRDVALLHLAQPLDLDSPDVEGIEVANEADRAAGLTDPDVVSTVTGWGALSAGGTSPDRLQTVDVPLVSSVDAQAAYPSETITDDQLAAGLLGVGGKDSCQGDSGGPLIVPAGSGVKLAGVVSWGYGCADPDYPGLYARVSSFATWIESITSSVTVPLLAESNLSAAQGAWTHYQVTVPAGARALTASITGGTGDADLYVKHGSEPTLSSYDCRPYKSGNNETCSIDAPATGAWYVSLHAYASYSGVDLTVTYRTDGPAPDVEICTDGADNDGDGVVDCSDSDCAEDAACAPPPACPGGELGGVLTSSDQVAHFNYSDANVGTFEATLTGDAGTNFDLYLEFQSGGHWRRAARSTSSDSSEYITYASAIARQYRWTVQRVSGTGSFHLCIASPLQ